MYIYFFDKVMMYFMTHFGHNIVEKQKRGKRAIKRKSI